MDNTRFVNSDELEKAIQASKNEMVFPLCVNNEKTTYVTLENLCDILITGNDNEQRTQYIQMMLTSFGKDVKNNNLQVFVLNFAADGYEELSSTVPYSIKTISYENEIDELFETLRKELYSRVEFLHNSNYSNWGSLPAALSYSHIILIIDDYAYYGSRLSETQKAFFSEFILKDRTVGMNTILSCSRIRAINQGDLSILPCRISFYSTDEDIISTFDSKLPAELKPKQLYCRVSGDSIIGYSPEFESE